MNIVTKDNNDRVMFFIDMRNVVKGSRDATGSGLVDYANMVDLLAGGRRITAAYIFDGRQESKKMYDALSYQGFRVVTRDAWQPDENIQKEVDMAMGTEMVSQAMTGSFDVAVVVSGDRDFLPAVEKVQSCGKRVEVAAFENSLSRYMLRGCDGYTYLDTLPIVTLDSETEIVDEDNGEGSVDAAEAEAF